jgi:broad specificity phosphatase PhoE
MKIFFVRHGETEYNTTGRLTGQTDIPMTAEGIRQTEKISLEIPSDISTLYSSDLLRCKQTVDILNKKRNLPVVYDARLRERDFGSFSGREWKDIDPEGTLKAADERLEYDYRPQSGESVEDVRKRVFESIEDIRQKNRGGAVLAVTSAGVIRLLHYSLNDKLHEAIHNSSMHEFEFSDTQ